MANDFDLSTDKKLFTSKKYLEYRQQMSKEMLQQSKTPYIHQTWDDFLSNQNSLGIPAIDIKKIGDQFSKRYKNLVSNLPWKKEQEQELIQQLGTVIDLAAINEDSVIKNIRESLTGIGKDFYSLEGKENNRANLTKRLQLIKQYVDVFEQYSKDLVGDITKFGSGSAATVMFSYNSKTKTSFARLKTLTEQLTPAGKSIKSNSPLLNAESFGKMTDPVDPSKILDALNYSGGSMNQNSNRTNLLIGEFFEILIRNKLSDGLNKLDTDIAKKGSNVQGVGTQGGKTDIQAVITESIKEFEKFMNKKNPNDKMSLNLNFTVKSGSMSTQGTYVNTGTLNTFVDLGDDSEPVSSSYGYKDVAFYALANAMYNAEASFNPNSFFSDKEATVYNNYLNYIVYGSFDSVLFQSAKEVASEPANIMISRDKIYTSTQLADYLAETLFATDALVDARTSDTLAGFAIELQKYEGKKFKSEDYDEILKSISSLKVAIKYRMSKNYFKTTSFIGTGQIKPRTK